MSSVFLNEQDAGKKQELIGKMGELRRADIISRAFPGTPVGGRSYDEAIYTTGANLSVKEVPISYELDGSPLKVPTHKAIVREDNGSFVSCVGRDFGVIQHADALQGLRPMVNSGDITLESIAIGENGGTVVATGMLGFTKVFQPGRDHTDALVHFVRVRNAHGFGAAVGGLYTLRLTCMNGQTTLAALDKCSINHSKYAARRIPTLHEAVFQAVAAAKQESLEFQQMAESKLSLEDFIIMSDRILTGIRGKADTDRKVNRREKDVTELARLFCEGKGNLGETKYDAFNAFTEWMTPRRSAYDNAKKFASKFLANESGQGRTIRRAVRKELVGV